MERLQRAPTALKVVAAVFILVGLYAAIPLIAYWLFGTGTGDMRPEVLGLLIGLGLLRFNYLAWTAARISLWIGLLTSALGTFVCIIWIVQPVAISETRSITPLTASGFGILRGSQITTPYLMLYAVELVIVGVFLWWQLGILNRPDVRSLMNWPISPWKPARIKHDKLGR